MTFKKKYTIIFFKLLFSITIIFYLIQNQILDFKFLLESFASNYYPIIFCLLLMLLVIILSTYRWFLILKISNNNLNFFFLFKVNYICIFFNNIFLGWYGSDLARAFYIYNLYEKKPIFPFSVIVDRAFGFVGIFLVFIICIFQNNKFLNLTSQFFHSLSFLLAIASCIILVIVILILCNYLKKKNVFDFSFSKIFLLIKKSFVDIIVVLIVTLMISVTYNFISYFLAYEVLKFNINLNDIFVANSASIIASAIPLSPAGLGVSEYSFSEIIKFMNKDLNLNGIANVIILVRIVSILSTLPSIFYFFTLKKFNNS